LLNIEVYVKIIVLYKKNMNLHNYMPRRC